VLGKRGGRKFRTYAADLGGTEWEYMREPITFGVEDGEFGYAEEYSGILKI